MTSTPLSPQNKTFSVTVSALHTLVDASRCSRRLQTSTCPAVPPMTSTPLSPQNKTFFTASRGSSLYGSKEPTLRNGGHSSSSSSSSLPSKESRSSSPLKNLAVARVVR